MKLKDFIQAILAVVDGDTEIEVFLSNDAREPKISLTDRKFVYEDDGYIQKPKEVKVKPYVKIK